MDLVPPPPPLPPPPTYSLPSLTNNSISNLNPLSNSFAQTVSIPSCLIKPTTAGLLQQQQPILNHDKNSDENYYKSSLITTATNTNNNNTNAFSLSSPKFKEELIRKQSQLSKSPVPVEERIKEKQQQKQVEMVYHDRENYNYNKQMAHLPDKLLLIAQREKKPFAYSPDVNDPNNRGKLDLSQIKSPIMRRRLLANMESKEELNEEEEEDEQEEEEEKNKQFEKNYSINYDNNINNNNELFKQPNQNYLSENEQPKLFMRQQKPTVDIKQHEPTKFENYMISNNRNKNHNYVQTSEQSTIPLVQYYERPVFYNTNNDRNSNLQLTTNNNSLYNRNSLSSSITPPSTSSESQLSRDRNRLDELSNEVTESLNSLSELVSNLEFRDNNNNQKRIINKKQEQISIDFNNQKQKMSSFASPSLQNNQTNVRNDQQRQPCYLSTLNPTFMVNQNYENNYNRSIGDFLLSPDSSYFSTPINCPYYGGSSNTYWNKNNATTQAMFNSRSNQSNANSNTLASRNKNF